MNPLTVFCIGIVGNVQVIEINHQKVFLKDQVVPCEWRHLYSDDEQLEGYLVEEENIVQDDSQLIFTESDYPPNANGDHTQDQINDMMNRWIDYKNSHDPDYFSRGYDSIFNEYRMEVCWFTSNIIPDSLLNLFTYDACTSYVVTKCKYTHNSVGKEIPCE